MILFKTRRFILIATVLWGVTASAGDEPRCVGGKSTNLAKVTQYFTKHVKDENDKACKKGGEGTCIFEKKGVKYVKTVDEPAVKQDETPCKFGRGKDDVCLSACDAVAADLKFHKPGDVLYFPDLKGTVCSDGSVNKTGRAVVVDRGDEIVGRDRFDFFIGECKNVEKGVCKDEKVAPIQKKLDQNISYCLVGTVKLGKGRSSKETLRLAGME